MILLTCNGFYYTFACFTGTELEEILRALRAQADPVDAAVSADYLCRLGYNWKLAGPELKRRLFPGLQEAVHRLTRQLLSPARSSHNQNAAQEPAACSLSPDQTRKTAAAISRLPVRSAQIKELCEVLASNVVRGGPAAEPGSLKEWGELLYGLAEAGGTYRRCPSFAALLDRALEPAVLPRLLHAGPAEGTPVSISNVFQAYAKARAPHTAQLEELAGIVGREVTSLMRGAPPRSQATLLRALEQLGVNERIVGAMASLLSKDA